jgi:broad specificity phosphatase PhoE
MREKTTPDEYAAIFRLPKKKSRHRVPIHATRKTNRSLKKFKLKLPFRMPEHLPMIYLARHGETAWSLSGQHTGLTNLPLTVEGEEEARQLGKRLAGLSFAKVFTSPLQRAAHTAELAGFGAVAEKDPDLVEWNYGKYEGLRTPEIHAQAPDWQLFRDGCPGGEMPAQIGARADRVLGRVRAVKGDVLIFSSGHFLRVLAARFLGLEPSGGKFFTLSTASVSILGFENNLSQPVIRLWNDTAHVSQLRRP